MRRVRLRVQQQWRLLNRTGLATYVRYRLARTGSEICLTIGDHSLWVRKGTPDIGVAVSCLIEDEFASLRNFLDPSYSGLIIDAGGYIGTAALALSKMYPKARVISIEPSDSNFRLLLMNTRSSNRIEAVQAALTSQGDSTVTLLDRGTGEWGFTVVAKPEDASVPRSLHSIKTISLSQLAPDPSAIGVLKLDIEGGERDLFLSDSDSLKKIGVIVVELHDRIVQGCSEAFLLFSEGRTVLHDSGEKIYSVINENFYGRSS